MAMTDPISDMLTRIRNASKARRKAVDIPASGLKREIARILIEHKYIKDMIELKDNRQGILRLYLKYSKQDEPIIRGLYRISRPGLRRYLSAQDAFRYTMGRRGIMIMSTSSGVMTDREAASKKVGGEALCSVW
jgi:small subunit ribosomal protein S8